MNQYYQRRISSENYEKAGLPARLIGSVFMIVALCGALPACGEAPAAPRNSEDVLGEWEIAEGGSIVTMRRCGEAGAQYCGQLSWMDQNTYAEDDPDAGKLKTDRANSDPALAAKPLLGIDLVHGFRWDPEQNRWVDGKIYNPFDGKTYNCWLEMESDQKLKIRGYVGLPILGMTVFWNRSEVAPAARGGFFAAKTP